MHGGSADYNDFQIDPSLSFYVQDLSYNQDLLQISFLNDRYVV